MSVNKGRRSQSVVVLVGVAVFGLLVAAGTAGAATSTLKLKVKQCLAVQWFIGARVDITITRDGAGTVDSGTAYTDSYGYVEFTYSNLEEDDVAHVTVTPGGRGADSNHVFVEKPDGLWDLSAQGDFGPPLCVDTWYDETNNIVLVEYRGN